MPHVVVIGAGQAGAALAARLRALKFQGEITVIGDEPAPPYQRPPLSKAYLLGEMEEERLWLRSADFWAENQITLKLGTPVTAIDPAARTVTVGEEVLAYDELALTTGSVPRRLPAEMGGALGGVHTVRTLADIDAIRAGFVPGRRLVVIGGGYIGLEAAAVARKLGLEVTVIEMAPRILQRVAAPETALYFRKLHAGHGAAIIEGEGVDRILGEGHVAGVRLKDGRVLPADFVIAGVGVVPATALAEAAGIALENGIRTDARGRTSAANVWAAGDCASFPLDGVQIRLESVGNAVDQAELVAANIMGADKDYVPKPWFWSDQYDCKLQIAGLNAGYDRVVARSGESEAVSIWYYAGDRLLAVDAMNDPRAFMVGKRLIEAGRTADPRLVADAATDLKALLR
ncbi:pyridine nucleotide-disulfide oxidoreductase [Paracoccus pantotrophus]|uniref:NAD(P)/FAD-dependent oxidoreductase n=1 Tax=Paracoccus pantotrophus TaxID=82367 RepID=UPI000E09ACAD|nr:FAD-dependent oxidoreductase [Paracoccus pantotrophus]RDD93025.1 pyridine nucleotide-disulfide oxidoreductase [Paracoccus pantotrophus]WGR65184.1 pyridine nucleotide-disulfide oxidoreductase [Paracoccus pantotrophus]